MTIRSLEPGYFDALYAADPDPWRFETSDYEDAKYRATLAALPAPHYRRGIEIGCSIGVLTERLAERCDTLLGVDIAPGALDAARRRCAALPHVRFEQAALPDHVPPGPFDLIMLSELLYYFAAPTMPRVAEAVHAMARPGNDIVLVHWLGPTPDYPLDGDAAVMAFLAAAPWAQLLNAERTTDYRLDVLRVT